MDNISNLKGLKRPNGLKEINYTFGNIDPEFERKYIVSAVLPYHLQLAWDHNTEISTIRCHMLLAERFQAIFEEIRHQSFCDKARYFGGCYAFRNKRNGVGLSTHAWGIAIDLNPETNRRGRPGDMAPEIAAIFAKFGFIWGGKWRGKKCDPMHFQYCSGY